MVNLLTVFQLYIVEIIVLLKKGIVGIQFSAKSTTRRVILFL
jgi:hypothetical protein